MNCPRRTGVLTKQEILLGRGAPVESSRVRDPELFCHMACSLRFYGDGISFRLSLANHSDSESFLVVHALFSKDGCQIGEFWEVVRHVVSHFDLS